MNALAVSRRNLNCVIVTSAGHNARVALKVQTQYSKGICQIFTRHYEINRTNSQLEQYHALSHEPWSTSHLKSRDHHEEDA